MWSYLKDYIGVFLTSSSTVFVCNSYLSSKLEYNNISLYNVIALAACVSVFSMIILVLVLIYLLVKWCKSYEESDILQEIIYFHPSFNLYLYCHLYIWYSIAIMGMLIGTGFYASYIIEEGIDCLSNIRTDWLILAGAFGTALIFLIICWIIVVCQRDKVYDD